ncbi:MAG: DUF2220 family protein [Desulfuromonas sp.]|nr:DUF2220 family protein [Desulfuromonas sp.]
MPEQIEPGQQLLLKLFQYWEQNPASTRRKSLPITKKRAAIYFETINPEDKDNLHACLINAEKQGCVELVWGKYHDSHSLQKIWLVNGEALGRFLNLTLASELVISAQQEVAQALPTVPEWIQRLFERVYAKWQKNLSAYRIMPGDTDSLILLAKALIAVSNNEQADLDLRTFSARILGDSKAMERSRERFSTVWNEEFSTGLNGTELYEYLGLSKFPAAIFIKGPVRVKVGGYWLQVDQVAPFLGIVPDTIEEIAPTIRPDYILTIENLASFNRHCREIQDNGIIFYTAGFMGPQSRRILKLLHKQFDDTIRTFHWGDIDIGGLNIAAHIQWQMEKKISLHLMTEELLMHHGQSAKHPLGRHSSFAINNNQHLLHLKQKIMDTGMILEQENIDPISPTSIS